MFQKSLFLLLEFKPPYNFRKIRVQCLFKKLLISRLWFKGDFHNCFSGFSTIIPFCFGGIHTKFYITFTVLYSRNILYFKQCIWNVTITNWFCYIIQLIPRIVISIKTINSIKLNFSKPHQCQKTIIGICRSMF